MALAPLVGLLNPSLRLSQNEIPPQPEMLLNDALELRWGVQQEVDHGVLQGALSNLSQLVDIGKHWWSVSIRWSVSIEQAEMDRPIWTISGGQSEVDRL